MSSYARRRKAGLCGRCGARPAPNRAACRPCLIAGNARSLARYGARKAAGECVRCGGKPLPGMNTCERCCAETNIRHKAVRARCLEGGICLNCCVAPALHGKHTCGACIAYMAEYRRRQPSHS